MLRLLPPWVACMVHSFHNAVQEAHGATSRGRKSTNEQDSEGVVPKPDGRRMNPQAKVRVSKI